MGLYEIGILIILVVILGVGVPMGCLLLRGIGDLHERTDRLSRRIESFHKELRDELKREIAGVRDELRGTAKGLRTDLRT